MNIEKICRFKKVFKNMQKKSFLTPLGFVRQYNSPKPYYSPSIIIQGNFHLSKHPNEWFDRFFTIEKLLWKYQNWNFYHWIETKRNSKMFENEYGL